MVENEKPVKAGFSKRPLNTIDYGHCEPAAIALN